MPTIKCANCAKTVERRGANARFCVACAGARKPRLAAPDRVRAGNYKGLCIDGQWCCVDCRTPIKPEIFNGKKCRAVLRCWPCWRTRDVARMAIRQRAANLVAKAIKAGELQRPGAFSCVDCGRPAMHYDHRDYTKPLNVVPVCRSCNVMRGPADIWPAGAPDAKPAADAR